MNLITNKPEFVLLSVYGSGDQQTDFCRHQALGCEFEDTNVRYKTVKGCYKGEQEYTFYIPLDNYNFTIDHAIELAKRYTQETILYVNSDRTALLIDAHNPLNNTTLGTFTQVIKEVALEQDAYTYDIEHDAYYICK